MEKDDLVILRTLAPFSEMNDSDFDTIIGKGKITNYPQGKMVFKRTDEDHDIYWLLSGTLDLLDEKFEAKNRKASDDAARYPIDDYNPHRLTAITTEESRVLTLPRDDLSEHLHLLQDNAEEPEDVDEGIDWMSALLSSPLFEFIPPANIQTLFSKFEEQTFDAGDVIITQGDPGDYFYVIQSGRVKVVRTVGDKTALQAELRAGDNFGQDALISNIARNATVSMATRGTLMRLSKPDFESLLMHPVLETVSREEALEMVENDDPKAYILDVRNPKERDPASTIEGSINVPLLLLRKNLRKLKTDAVYVTVCDGSRRAELAAYILNEKGFTAYVLQ